MPPKVPLQPLHGLPGNQFGQQPMVSPPDQRMDRAHQQASPPLLTYEQTVETIDRYFTEFDDIWSVAREGESMPSGEDLVEHVWVAVNNSANKEESQHFVCQKLVQVLLSTKSDAARHVYASFLSQLQMAAVKSAQDAVDWFLATEDKVSPDFRTHCSLLIAVHSVNGTCLPSLNWLGLERLI